MEGEKVTIQQYAVLRTLTTDKEGTSRLRFQLEASCNDSQQTNIPSDTCSDKTTPLHQHHFSAAISSYACRHILSVVPMQRDA